MAKFAEGVKVKLTLPGVAFYNPTEQPETWVGVITSRRGKDRNGCLRILWPGAAHPQIIHADFLETLDGPQV